MSPRDYLAILEARTGLTKFADGQDGTILCQDRNGTHFAMIDPRDVPERERAELLEVEIASLARNALGY